MRRLKEVGQVLTFLGVVGIVTASFATGPWEWRPEELLFTALPGVAFSLPGLVAVMLVRGRDLFPSRLCGWFGTVYAGMLIALAVPVISS